jgi:hypothetical protein
LIAGRAAWLAATLLLISMALAARRAKAEELSTRLIPLPMYATVPNEGSTYGFMPVFFRTSAPPEVDTSQFSDSDLNVIPVAAVHSIIAPSLSWNAAAGVTGTFRYFRYLDPVQTWTLVVSFSTHINRTVWYTYDNLTREPGGVTTNAVVMVRRNLFFRYFGLGPDTEESGESSYTRTTSTANGRWGYNLTRFLNLGGYAELRGDWLEQHAIFDLPTTQQLHPDAPGLDGAMVVRGGLSLRFDTREGGDYAENGMISELNALVAESIGGGPYGQVTSHTRGLLRETSWLQGAGRVYWTQIFHGGNELPFYYRPSLGGEFLLRGYADDRFIAMGAWEVEIEQRIRMLQTHMFDVTADWRVDPFLAIGQVYDGSDLFSHVRVTGGIGLRAWVHPNVLGRVDLAYGDEGLRAYVMLGYPY